MKQEVPNSNPYTLEYPLFLAERKSDGGIRWYDVIFSQAGFTTFGRVPLASQYSNGHVFDSSGRVYVYLGASGWPRFSQVICNVLDNLIIPGLFFRGLGFFVYFGPKLVSSERLDLEEFEAEILTVVRGFQDPGFEELKKSVLSSTDFRSVIEGVDWYRFHGGDRDEDGHPI